MMKKVTKQRWRKLLVVANWFSVTFYKLPCDRDSFLLIGGCDYRYNSDDDDGIDDDTDKDENALLVKDENPCTVIWCDDTGANHVDKRQMNTNDVDDKKEDYNDENDNYCPGGLIACDKRWCR